MNTRYISLIAVVIVAVVLAGCFDDLTGPYDEGDQVGFDIDLVTQPSTALGASGTFREDSTYTLSADLIGPQRSQAVDIGISIVTDEVYNIKEVRTDTGAARIDTTVLALPTTATESNYNVPSSLTIEANSSSATFDVQIPDALASGADPVRLALRLDGSADGSVEPAENLRYFTLVIEPND